MSKEEVIEKEYKEVNKFNIPKDLSKPDFKNISKCHDWKSYVPDNIIACWSELTSTERKLIVILCENSADSEEWD